MNRTTFFIALSALLTFSIAITSCKNEPKKPQEPEQPKKEVIETNGKVLEWLPADVVKYIWDYKENPKEIVYKGDKVCVIDFNATWCAPCRSLKPHLDKMAEKYNGKAYIIGLDVDKKDKTGSNLSIFERAVDIFRKTNPSFKGGIPALVLISADGKKTKSVVGFSKANVDLIDKFISENM